MNYKTQCTSVNRLDKTDESKALVDQVFIDVKKLTGIFVHQYHDYNIEETIAKIDPDDLKLKLGSYLEYLKSFDNNNTHMDILWAVQHSFTALSIVNEEIRIVCRSLQTRYNTLREMQQEIHSAENKVLDLKYFQNNWEALTTTDPKVFVRLLKVNRDHHLVYEKFTRLKVADNIVNDFFGLPTKINDDEETNAIIDTITPFALAIAKIDAGFSMTTLMCIQQFKSIPKGKELCDKVFALKQKKLEKTK